MEYLLLFLVFVTDALGEPPPCSLLFPLPLHFLELLAGGKALEGNNIPRSVFSSFFSSRSTSTISFCDCGGGGGGFFELTTSTTPPFVLTGALDAASAATLDPVAFDPVAFDPGCLDLVDAGGGAADAGGGAADAGGNGGGPGGGGGGGKTAWIT